MPPTIRLVRSAELSSAPYAYASVVDSAFGEHDVPSALMGVTVLGYDDQLVEIEAIAALSD